MAKTVQRKCLCCGRFFDVDGRVRERHRYCSEPACRRASKAASQAAWLAKPQNRHYFRDPVHVARVQAWRTQHPGYSRGKRRERASVTRFDESQVHDCIEESSNLGEIADTGQAPALQDLLSAPSPVLAGLIAHLFGTALQEEIEATTRRLVQMGHDLINGSRHEDSKASAASRAVAPGARAVQLG